MSRFIPRRIFRPVTTSSNTRTGRLMGSLRDLNKVIPWRIFRLITMISIAGAALACVFMAYVRPFFASYYPIIQNIQWWPWH